MASKAETITIRPEEVAHFGALASTWWDPDGPNAMLHKLGPPRLRFLRDSLTAHWGCAREDLQPLAGRRALDVGCGAGLLAEPLARLGAEVVGIDATPENIAVARDHAAAGGLAIDYRAGGIEGLDAAPFDLVTCMEVIEHVAAPDDFVRHLARRLAPGGLLILSTPNRTALSRLAMITVGEGLKLIPRGTHDWRRFLTPEEVDALLDAHGLATVRRAGLSFSPAQGIVLSEDMRMNMILAAVRK